MILPDVNILVFAYRADAEHHEAYATWLNALIRSDQPIGLAETVITGFLRLVTNPRVLADPPKLSKALGFIKTLRGAPSAHTLKVTPAVWKSLESIAAADRQVRANLVPDAWLAALAIAHGARLATADRGFARFDGLDWFDPAAGDR